MQHLSNCWRYALLQSKEFFFEKSSSVEVEFPTASQTIEPSIKKVLESISYEKI